MEHNFSDEASNNPYGSSGVPGQGVQETSGMAITSMVLGLLSIFVLPAIPAIILGVLALRKIGRSNGRLSGNGLAVTGICTGVVGLLFVGLITALILPAVTSARGTARRTQSMNNMKQVVLAMHNYHEIEGSFPLAGVDENGVGPKLSWRVHILPYIDEQGLYEKFHLDEPWDSPYNKELISQMPEIYELPDGLLDPGKTVYLAVTGPGAAFQGGEVGPALEDFTDGSSKTIILVEANVDQAVIWTKPADWQFDPNNPKHGLGSLRKGGFQVAFADGHVRFITSELKDETLKAIFTRDGGEAVSADGL